MQHQKKRVLHIKIILKNTMEISIMNLRLNKFRFVELDA
jgi:hypothetical protein